MSEIFRRSIIFLGQLFWFKKIFLNCYEGVDSDNKCYVDGSATDSVPNLLLCEGDCPSLNYNRDTAKFNYEFADNVNNFTSILVEL